MHPVEFVGKDFFLFPAVRALANKRLEILALFKTGAMLRSSHGFLLSCINKIQGFSIFPTWRP